jgi:hypothetical protein
MAPFSSRMISHFVIAVAVAIRRGRPARQPSPQNSSGPRTATTASFPCSETTVRLTSGCRRRNPQHRPAKKRPDSCDICRCCVPRQLWQGKISDRTTVLARPPWHEVLNRVSAPAGWPFWECPRFITGLKAGKVWVQLGVGVRILLPALI